MIPFEYKPFSNSKNFQKMFKKEWKIYNFLKIFKGILLFFEIFSKFSRKFMEKFRKFWKYVFVRGSRDGAQESCENIKKLVEKSMEKWKHQYLNRRIIFIAFWLHLHPITAFYGLTNHGFSHVRKTTFGRQQIFSIFEK